MAFTYELAENRGAVRLWLGDSTEDIGPRPRKNNYSDAEIDYLLSSQSNSVKAAVAAGFDLLASEWMSYSLAEKEADLSYDAKGLAEQYAKLAKDWWAKPDDGSSGSSLQAGIILMDFAEKGGAL